MAEAIQDRQTLNALVARLWAQKKDLTLGRIAIVEQASSAVASGSLTKELRGHAAGEAHKLAGSLGTFGFSEGSRLSRAMEVILASEAELNRDDGERLAQLLSQLRSELQAAALPVTNDGADSTQK
jgi:HPt (histidine-containing phosphotransfer) domain-containing protein